MSKRGNPGNTGTTTYLYLGNTVKVTDPAGKWKTYTVDVFGNLTRVEEPGTGGGSPVALAVYKTGVDNSGALLADGATDPHYTLVTSADPSYPGPAAKVVNSGVWPIPPWLANGPGSKWIGPRQDAANGNTAGDYTYRMTFDLTGLNPATAQLSGRWATDNAGTLKLNGVTVSASASFTAWTNFTIATGFVSGVNTLDFVVNNTPPSASPTGLRVEISGTASPLAGSNYFTNYTYDLYNRLTEVSMPRNGVTQTRKFNYDGSTQRLMSVVHPESGTTSFVYNTDGTLWKRTDAKGQEIRYTYDTKKRVTAARRYVSGVEQACQAVTYTYDSGAYAIGRLSSMQWGGAACTGGYSYTEAYAYAQPGNVLTKTLTAVNAQSQAAALAATFTYDNEGRRTAVKYPNWNDYGTPVTGPTYTYGFDALARPVSLTDGGQTWVQNVVYNVASQITSMQYLQYTGGPAWLTETRGYNTRLQMTSQTVAPSGGGAALMDLRYNYHAAANNGRIESMQDLVTGETVSYQYDALQRLISATAGTAWGNAYSYDGFGNLLSKTVTAGTAPTLSVNVDGTTNRITTAGYTYDLNGNLTAVPGVTGMAYDVDNRLTSANGEAYAYTPVNQRVWLRKSGGTERFAFYDLNGQRLAEYTPWVNGGTLYFVQVKAELYFGGKRIRSGGYAVAEDRLGSTRRDDTTASRFFPWGEENGSTANDRQKFATYYRDAGTGLDYANQRYYSATIGRFLTPDPYQASGGPTDPGSWNRYGYVIGDPVNRLDPTGLDYEIAGGETFNPADPRNVAPGGTTVTVSAGGPDPLADAWIQMMRTMGMREAPFQLEFAPLPMIAPITTCGVNPVTGLPGFSAQPRGEEGHMRPGVGGGGRFGDRRLGGREHRGLDISGTSGESSVYASLGGTITRVGTLRGYGLTVEIDVGNGYTQLYSHLSAVGDLRVGLWVDQGAVLGVLGQTGNAAGQPLTEAHVHFEVRNNGRAVNPSVFLNIPCPWWIP